MKTYIEKFTIVETVPVNCGQTEEAATRFAIVLTGDKGVPTTIQPHGVGHVVIADDSKAVLFLPSGRKETRRPLTHPAVAVALRTMQASGLPSRARLDSLVSHFAANMGIDGDHLTALQADAWVAWKAKN